MCFGYQNAPRSCVAVRSGRRGAIGCNFDVTAGLAFAAMHRVAPEDVDIITPLGLLHLENGNPNQAFDLFGAALAYNQKDPKVRIRTIVCDRSPSLSTVWRRRRSVVHRRPPLAETCATCHRMTNARSLAAYCPEVLAGGAGSSICHPAQ